MGIDRVSLRWKVSNLRKIFCKMSFLYIIIDKFSLYIQGKYYLK